MNMVNEAKYPTNAVATLRAAGKLTLADEAHLVRLYHGAVSRSPEAARILGAQAAAQVGHYEAALIKR